MHSIPVTIPRHIFLDMAQTIYFFWGFGETLRCSYATIHNKGGSCHSPSAGTYLLAKPHFFRTMESSGAKGSTSLVQSDTESGAVAFAVTKD